MGEVKPKASLVRNMGHRRLYLHMKDGSVTELRPMSSPLPKDMDKLGKLVEVDQLTDGDKKWFADLIKDRTLDVRPA